MILSIFFIILFSLIPIVLWAYGHLYLSPSLWNQRRFFFGMFSGWFSVALISLLHTELLQSGWIRFWALWLIFWVLFWVIWIITLYGSKYIRWFLRKLALLHGVIFLLVYIIFFLLEKLIPVSFFSVGLFVALSGLIFSASLEEGIKHLSTLGTSASSFRFSRADFLAFTLFITLWFVFIENILFFIQIFNQWTIAIIQVGCMRLLFALLAHFFAASICVVWWWKALSYGVFSYKYSLFFFIGFILSVLAHTLFNFLIIENLFLGILLFSLIAYIFITRWMLSSDQEINLLKDK